MKKLLLTVLALSSVSAFAVPSRHECDLRDANAAADLRYTQDRFNVGEVTRTDVNFAKIAVLNIQLDCAEIVRGNADVAGSYCSQENLDMFDQYVGGVREEAMAGQKTAADVKDANNLKIAMKVICD